MYAPILLQYVRARAPRFTRAVPQSAPIDTAVDLQRPTINLQKSICQNLVMRQSYGPCRIFLAAFLISRFPKYGHILGETLCSGRWRRPGQASPWEHEPSSSAPCVVTIRRSTIGEHIKGEPWAKQRALLSVSSSRCSSVSRGVRSVGSIYTYSPLVHV
jgi:hypothetical protein